jgi:uncharacterized protein
MKNEHPTKRKWILRLLIGIGAAALLVLLIGGAVTMWTDTFVDILWFDNLGYALYFWMRHLYQYAVFAAVLLVFFLVFFLNFWTAARFLKSEAPSDKSSDPAEDRTRRRRLRHAFQTGTIWFYGPLSVVLGVLIALPLFTRWEEFLFFIFGSNMGVADPFLGRDVSFYLFSFPIYRLLQRRLLIALLVLTVSLLLLYMSKNRVQGRSLFNFRRGARWHLSLLVLALFGLGVWEFMLQRYDLVYGTTHQDLIFGPGYVEMKIVLPLIWACMVLLALTGVALLVMVQRGKLSKSGIAVSVLFGVALALRYTPALPQLIQTYVVLPNEIAKEGPYITDHIQATLNAYQLTDMEIRDFSYRRFPSAAATPQVEKVLRNIPVWDAESLVEVFQQLQELRTYYYFPKVNVGRYTMEGHEQQVYLAPRELEFTRLPGQAHNWINEHLTYTHGFGAVMAPASQTSGSGMTWYMYDIPPKSAYGLVPKQSRIYYGLGKYRYSIAPNRSGEMDYPQGNSNVLTRYDGRGGIPVSSLLRKSLFAYYLKNKNVFFSTKITPDSRLLIRRNIVERIRYLVPFLQLDSIPYAATTSQGIYWIVDAYTTSPNYPASAPQTLGSRTFNYIRNSVKIVVDAFNGTVDFYINDPKDPIIRAYNRIYPGLFKPLDALSKELRAHLRYPKDFFTVQMQIYAKYHQQNVRVYYQQEDLWSFPTSAGENNTLPLRPYYVTLDLFKPGRMDFMLLLPMFPKNRDNLRAMTIAGCDPESYGKRVIYNFPKGQLVFGPAQINALINQDPDIAEQFTLWDQAGSQIVRGKMIILPVGRSVLFIQPVYLRATSRVKIPELQRIIMSEGSVVVMEKSIQGAYLALQKRVAQQEEVAQSKPGIEPGSPPSPPQLPDSGTPGPEKGAGKPPVAVPGIGAEKPVVE